MLRTKKTLAIVAVAAAGIAGAVVSAAPASAGTGDCGVRAQCGWEHADYNGEVGYFLQATTVGSYWNDRVSSISNTAGRSFRNHNDINYLGDYWTSTPKNAASSGKYGNLSYIGYNDKLSSLR
ncbi:hypothetical protein C5B85_18255 [Pseudoclavibacter sp. AY1F1]|uniref:peptidase inhibitor family I36 protein n=1 Tax=Pseudoclavibacter sp. AY1F1 TaxID=2080583 RepID=UPI000CE8F530|nr:peptidase inhibitor family I36 protein [Pseudoclavibacter sp. AY1F1]PPF41864.1 hypothetical protein C5B85_18255 [Pseudoclavibacter sp. AY1F1]